MAQANDPNYLDLFEFNRNWADQYRRISKERMASARHPEILYIGCCDNLIPVSELMGIDPTKVIIHRNIANLVIAIDPNVMSVIHYAVDHLKVKRIIVCGHHNCGCIKTAMKPQDYGSLNSWLKSVRDVYRDHKDELNAISDEVRRLDRLAELSVLDQCQNAARIAVVQNNYIDNGYPTVHGWIFDPETGMLNDLNFDFKGTIDSVQQIYNLSSESFFDAEGDEVN
jgi:carbonic anhydrase